MGMKRMMGLAFGAVMMLGAGVVEAAPPAVTTGRVGSAGARKVGVKANRVANTPGGKRARKQTKRAAFHAYAQRLASAVKTGGKTRDFTVTGATWNRAHCRFDVQLKHKAGPAWSYRFYATGLRTGTKRDPVFNSYDFVARCAKKRECVRLQGPNDTLIRRGAARIPLKRSVDVRALSREFSTWLRQANSVCGRG